MNYNDSEIQYHTQISPDLIAMEKILPTSWVAWSEKSARSTKIKYQFTNVYSTRLIKQTHAGNLLLVSCVLRLVKLPNPSKLPCLLVLAIN